MNVRSRSYGHRSPRTATSIQSFLMEYIERTGNIDVVKELENVGLAFFCENCGIPYQVNDVAVICNC